jgi:Predicted acyl-CoA transferases/carnitine dehydratase
MKPVLEDVSVIDLSTFVTGGFSSLMLAAQGADVIKIERPDVGDDIRHSGPPFINGESPYYWTVNYDKRSVELDLKTEPGKTRYMILSRQQTSLSRTFDLVPQTGLILHMMTSQHIMTVSYTVISLRSVTRDPGVNVLGMTYLFRD